MYSSFLLSMNLFLNNIQFYMYMAIWGILNCCRSCYITYNTTNYIPNTYLHGRHIIWITAFINKNGHLWRNNSVSSWLMSAKNYFKWSGDLTRTPWKQGLWSNKSAPVTALTSTNNNTEQHANECKVKKWTLRHVRSYLPPTTAWDFCL